MSNTFIDNGGRRTGADRRTFLYAVCLPERRVGKDRRSHNDRRAAARFNIIVPQKKNRRKNFPFDPSNN